MRFFGNSHPVFEVKRRGFVSKMELVAAAQKDPEVMDLSVEGVEIGDARWFKVTFLGWLSDLFKG